MSSISHILASEDSESSVSGPTTVPHTSTSEIPQIESESDTIMTGETSQQPKQSEQEQEQEQDQDQDQETETEYTQQRKRSKVSRACDECRRKKIRCDAVLNSTSSKLEKSCSSCSKNGYVCSFERVPLKRGPTKGYVKVDHLGNWDAKSSQRVPLQSQPVPVQGQQQQSNHQSQGSTSSITLPPLTSITNVPFQNIQPGPSSGPSPVSGFTFNQQQQQQQQQQQPLIPPASPGRSRSINRRSSSQSQQQRPVQVQNNLNTAGFPQSQFWKVPYQAPFDRRGSVDSVSSSYSNSSSQGIQFAPRYESSVISDSDDERNLSPRASLDFRNRSRSNSNSNNGPVSPALSISSLKSLNQGLSKTLNLNGNNSTTSLQSFVNPLPLSSQVNTNHLVDLYYRFIHPTFPILPLNNQYLITILSKPQSQPPQNEFDELNFFITQSFYSSLDLLVSTLSRQRSPINSPNSRQILNQSTENLHLIYNGLSRIFKKVTLQFDHFPQHTIILFLSSLTILSLTVVLLGDSSDVVVVGSTVKLFNRLKIYKLFWPDNNPDRIIENFDEFELILKRIWLNINLLDSLHSISNGIPKHSILDLDFSEVDKLFPDLKVFEPMKDNSKLGLILAKICHNRTFFGPFLTVSSIIEELKVKIPSDFQVSKDQDQNYLPGQLWETILVKFELIKFLEEITTSFPQTRQQSYDEELLFDYQLKLLRLIRKTLTIQTSLFSCIKNHTNSLDSSTGSPISPLLPLIFKQTIKSLNIIKILINSLQLSESLVVRLSKLLNDLIKLSNFLSLIKPFLDPELNNHLKFEFRSIHLEFWEDFQQNESLKSNVSEVRVQESWIGLMRDVLKYLKEEDYDGWF